MLTLSSELHGIYMTWRSSGCSSENRKEKTGYTGTGSPARWTDRNFQQRLLAFCGPPQLGYPAATLDSGDPLQQQ